MRHLDLFMEHFRAEKMENAWKSIRWTVKRRLKMMMVIYPTALHWLYWVGQKFCSVYQVHSLINWGKHFLIAYHNFSYKGSKYSTRKKYNSDTIANYFLLKLLLRLSNGRYSLTKYINMWQRLVRNYISEL